jgi:nitrate reductase cytochrome c-type subunit
MRMTRLNIRQFHSYCVALAGALVLVSSAAQAQTAASGKGVGTAHAGNMQSETTRAASLPAQTARSAPHWHKVSVTLPVSTRLFPAGEGAETANSQCLLCHSVEMVLTQPSRSEAQWKETINKMRTAYGAPLPADQVDALATYLARLGTPR